MLNTVSSGCHTTSVWYVFGTDRTAHSPVQATAQPPVLGCAHLCAHCSSFSCIKAAQ